jgi:hypothetical protein
MNPIYEAGTISVAAGGTTVTGQSTLFLTQGIRPGDQFRAQGLSATIVSVNSNTSLTIKPWPGQAINTGNYEIQRVSDANRLLDATYLLMANLSNNLLALGQLTGASNKLPYFTGPNALALADLSAQARQLLDDTSFAAMQTTLGLVPTSSATDSTGSRLLKVGDAGILGAPPAAPSNIGVTDNTVPRGAWLSAGSSSVSNGLPSSIAASSNNYLFHHRRVDSGEVQLLLSEFATSDADRTLWFRRRTGGAWGAWKRIYDWGNVVGTVSQSGGVPNGALFDWGANANGQYLRLPDGTQFCRHIQSHNVSLATSSLNMGFRNESPLSWIYPASFVTPPTPGITPLNSGAAALAQAPTASEATYFFGSSSSQGAANRTVFLTAEGRWF